MTFVELTRGFPETPASRLELVMSLIAPLVYDEETGESHRDESYGLITREQAIEILEDAG